MLTNETELRYKPTNFDKICLRLELLLQYKMNCYDSMVQVTWNIKQICMHFFIAELFVPIVIWY